MTDLAHSPCPSPDELKERAVAATGLDDFGDPARDEGLGVLLASMAEESWAGMTPAARDLAGRYLVHLLENRLRLVADRKAHPEIAAQKIVAPLIVVGPPRSGSTLLHTLLSLDPEAMSPEHWVCREPSPPPALGAPSAARLEAADRQMMDLFSLIPDVFVTHPYMIEEGSGSLAECGSDIMSMAFTAQQLWCFWGGDTYRDWLVAADHAPAADFHHDFLQHLQWGAGGTHWALKGSDHMLRLRALGARYPDAKLVWNHRDLSQQLASLASVQAILRGLNGHPVTPELRRAQGRKAIALQHESAMKGLAAREAMGDGQFIDVSFHDVMADHVGAVERIYDQAGMAMSGRHADAIRQWVADHPVTKHGAHRHSPEEFGMDGDEINALFAPYTERFGFGFGIRPPLAA